MKNAVAEAIDTEMYRLRSPDVIVTPMELVQIAGKLLAQAVNEIRRLQERSDEVDGLLETAGALIQRQRDARILLRNSLGKLVDVSVDLKSYLAEQGGWSCNGQLVNLERSIVECRCTLDETK
jgi:hypothetical protein